MYLVDTNVWLELLLEQERAGEVRQFLQETPTSRLWVFDADFDRTPLGRRTPGQILEG